MNTEKLRFLTRVCPGIGNLQISETSLFHTGLVYLSEPTYEPERESPSAYNSYGLKIPCRFAKSGKIQ